MRFVTLASVAVVAMATASVTSAASPGSTSGIASGDLIGFEQMEYVAPVASDFTSGSTAAVPLLADYGTTLPANTPRNPGFVASTKVKQSFEGISQYDVASYGRNFIPPDTMGAVGTTQFTEFANGGFAVFGKDGTVQKSSSDLAFWAAAGQVGANGDSRVRFDAAAGRWIALSFGANVSDIQIAVSNTADATGVWQSTKFTGFTGRNAVADYPTLAFDNNAVYIGTNNFSNPAIGGSTFKGTTLNVIPISSLLGAGAPTTAGLKQFNTPYNNITGGYDGGYAIQGVNSTAAGPNGKILALSLFYNTNLTYDITNAGQASAQEVNGRYIGGTSYGFANPGRQPNAVPDAGANASFANNDRVIDTLDPRVGSSVYENNGLIYSVQTVSIDHGAHSAVLWQIVDAATDRLVSEGTIQDGVHDYFEGSLSVNAAGQVVIGYNRSGSGADGKVSVFARTYTTSATGGLVQRGDEILLHVSDVDDYHNGSLDGFVAAGRQRWGDYSQVTLDPTDPTKFWVIGEFAREYNDAAGGHPGGSGGSRWSTWISEIDATTATNVPEPASWALFIAGFGTIGAMQRRRRTGYTTA